MGGVLYIFWKGFGGIGATPPVDLGYTVRDTQLHYSREGKLHYTSVNVPLDYTPER